MLSIRTFLDLPPCTACVVQLVVAVVLVSAIIAAA